MVRPLCITCNRQVQEAIWNSSFMPNLLTILSAFFVLGGMVFLLALLAGKRYRSGRNKKERQALFSPIPLLSTAMILGIGIGGFIDGIVLHQILQWHEMLSAKLPPVNLVNKSVNMFWDGIFHAFTLVVTFVGIIQLWRLMFRTDIDRSGRLLAGGLLIGWGLFNLVEGIIDHQILKLHNVREITENVEAWNLGFLALSLLMILGGWRLSARRSRSY